MWHEICEIYSENKGDRAIGGIIMRMKNLEKCFEAAKKENASYVGVLVQMEGYKADECIINKAINFDKKLEYYKFAYNDDLTLKNAPDKIKIVGFTYGNDVEDIACDLEL
ncbi:MAG: hypothetical protein ACRDDY_16160 [Clostridium sp.]